MKWYSAGIASVTCSIMEYYRSASALNNLSMTNCIRLYYRNVFIGSNYQSYSFHNLGGMGEICCIVSSLEKLQIKGGVIAPSYLLL